MRRHPLAVGDFLVDARWANWGDKQQQANLQQGPVIGNKEYPRKELRDTWFEDLPLPSSLPFCL